MGEKSDAKGSTTWRKMITKRQTAQARSKRKSTVRFQGGKDAASNIAKAGASATASYLWNYNSVEGTLLSCAVFINLAGIMFQAYADCGRDLGSYYEPQKKALTYIVMIVITTSILYFCLVFGSEVISAINPPCLRGKKFVLPCSKAAKQAKKAAIRQKRIGDTDLELEMGELDLTADSGALKVAMNPMMRSGGIKGGTTADVLVKSEDLPEQPPGVTAWIRVKSDYGVMEGNIKKLTESMEGLRDEINRLKKDGALVGAGSRGAGSRASISRARSSHAKSPRKKEFKDRAAGRAMRRTRSKSSKSMKPKKAPMRRAGSWVEIMDDSKGRAYYHNSDTNETTWVEPSEFKGKTDAPAKALEKIDESAGASLSGKWKKATDESGKTYYFNSSTGETSWTPPSDM